MKIPPSKSYTQRALFLGALADGVTTIVNPLDCDDTKAMRRCLKIAGAVIDDSSPYCWTISGIRFNDNSKNQHHPSHGDFNKADQCRSSHGDFNKADVKSQKTARIIDLPSNDAGCLQGEILTFPCGNGGTVLRFISSLVLLLKRPIQLDGLSQLRTRPVSMVTDTLASTGCQVVFPEAEDRLPVIIYPPGYIHDTIDIGDIVDVNDVNNGESNDNVDNLEEIGGVFQVESNPDGCNSDRPAIRTGTPVTIHTDPGSTSQVLSGLLMIGPVLEQGLKIILKNRPRSIDYIYMTLHMMKLFGYSKVSKKPESFGQDSNQSRASTGKSRSLSNEHHAIPSEESAQQAAAQIVSEIEVLPVQYKAATIHIESDWSSAAVILTASWLTGMAVEIENLNYTSLQGDRKILQFLEQLPSPAQPTASSSPSNLPLPPTSTSPLSFGQTSTQDSPQMFNLANCPDIIGPLTIAALFSTGTTTLTGIRHARIKECDRPHVLASQLALIGADIVEINDELIIQPLTLSQRKLNYRDNASEIHRTVTLNSYNDHRMAMAFGLLSLKLPFIEISDKDCVSKSYPLFFEDLARIFQIRKLPSVKP